jgi:hypothetical protein
MRVGPVCLTGWVDYEFIPLFPASALLHRPDLPFQPTSSHSFRTQQTPLSSSHPSSHFHLLYSEKSIS